MKIQSSDGRVLKVSPQDEKAVRNMIESGNHEGVEAYFKKAESESFKKGGMLKRKDGSYSRRGLWDNIRANRGSGRKPTKEMLKQEAKIRAKQAAGGTVFKGYVTEQPMGKAVPWHTSTIMAEGGEVDDWKVTYDPANPDVYETMPVLSDKKRAKILQNNPNAIFEEFQPAEKTAAPTLSKEELDALKSNLFNKYYGQVTSDSEGRGYDYFSRLPEFQNIPDKDKGDLIRRMSSYLQQPSNLYTTPEESTNYSTGYYREPVPMNSDLTPRRLAGYGESEAYGKGGYTVKRSSARKGKTHVVIGPDGTKKYFGDSKLGQHPKDPARKKSFYARHKHNLAKNPYFRAFARATWADGGKLTDNMYDRGIMPYDFGGPAHHNPSIYGISPSHSTAMRVGYETDLNPDGTIHVPYGFGTPAYNERYDLGGDIGAGLTGVIGGALGTVPVVGGFLKQGVNKLDESIQGPLSNQEKSIRGYGNAVGGVGAGLFTGNIPAAISSGASGIAEGISYGSPNSKTAQQISQGLNLAGTVGGLASGYGAFGNIGQNAAKSFAGTNLGQAYSNLGKYGSMSAPLMNMLGGMGYGGYVHMADGGQTGLVPINVEGADFSEGSGPDAKKGELLVLNGKVIKNYVGRPPHPAEGQDPLGNDDAPEGLIVIPKARTKEYLEAGLEKRKQIERSLVSQQQDREMRKSRKMGDGGYYSFGMGDQGMNYGGPIGNPETINDITYGTMKKGGWIQKATASIKRRGTEGVCTGSKFGSSSCPPGSRRYNLAKTFRAMAKRRKHEDGGFIDPVTGSHTVMYKEGGPTIHDFPTMRVKYQDAGPVRKRTYTPTQETKFQKYFRIYPERPETDSLLEKTSPGSALAGYIGTTICGEGGCRPYVAPNLSEERRMELYREAWQEKYNQGYDPSTRSRNPYDKRLLELFPPDPNRPVGQVVGPDGKLRNYGPPVPNMDYFSPDFIHWWNEVDSSGKKIPRKKQGGPVGYPRLRYDKTSLVAPYADEYVPDVMSPRQQAITDYINSGKYITGSGNSFSQPSMPSSNNSYLTPADNSFDYYGDGYPAIFGNQTPPEMDPAQLNQGTPISNSLVRYSNTPSNSVINSQLLPKENLSIGNSLARTGQPSSGMSIARANRSPYSIGALRGIPEGTASERYMQGVDQDLRKTFPDLYSSSKYGTSSMSNPSSSSDYNYANMMQDTASMLPALYNLGRGAFEKPVKMNYLDYTTPEMQFRKTKFDPTPYDYASSRAQYALRQAGAGPGYKAGVGNIAAQVAQARSSGYMDWMNKEALRRQGVDEANLGIAARNKAMQLQIALLNQQAKANRNKYFETATEQFAQEFGRNPMYFRAMAGESPRQPFTGWKKP